ncbi:LRR domain containing protein [Parasponia andersonii]|uniref:LRR domain containing protein n=1 Tax=Parasponia andersonii TaxID=3476 RepID=A0A2P5A9M6_PARAD|nr:LRR domain containing protein [Parasponia andersonii]
MENLSNLEWLDLSSNELVGKIPWQLAANLKQLGFLNLYISKLEGPIPLGPQFNTFKEDSYGWNLGLCGFPVWKSCSSGGAQQECDHDKEHRDGLFGIYSTFQ